jgi:hypothetical protein
MKDEASKVEARIKKVRKDAADRDIMECEDLMSKLDLAIEADGPPVHLESGLRLIHSLRSRMAVYGRARRDKHKRCSPGRRLEVADCATVDLLFWLGVMFDTLSAAMHKRPLVTSAEDSDVARDESMQTERSIDSKANIASPDLGDGV